MSPVLSDGNSLFIAETKTLASGYEIFQKLLHTKAKPVEAFSTLNGSFVILMNGEAEDLKQIQKTILKKNILQTTVIENINDSVIKGFYNLLKNSPKDFIVVVETKTVSEAFRACQSACARGLEIVEFRSARSLVGLNVVVLTGDEQNLRKILLDLKKNKKTNCSKVIATSASFRSFFSFP